MRKVEILPTQDREAGYGPDDGTLLKDYMTSKNNFCHLWLQHGLFQRHTNLLKNFKLTNYGQHFHQNGSARHTADLSRRHFIFV